MTDGSISAQRGPLRGYKVLEIAHYIAGPHCTMILGDHGAEVVKIEPPGGEAARFDQHYFAAQNRRKKSVALDLASPAGRPARDALLAWADVVVTNYTLGVPDRLGFGFARLQELNPRASLIHITGYGSWTPRAQHAAYDGAIQAMSGFAELNGDPERGPLLSTIFVADHSAGVHAANAALCALLERQQSGKGSHIEVSMICSMTSMLGRVIATEVVENRPARGYGNRNPARPFVSLQRTRDGYVYFAPITIKMWREVTELMQRPHWCPEDGRTIQQLFADETLRQEVEQAVADWIAGFKSTELVQLLQSRGVASSEVRNIRKLYEDAAAENSGEVISVRLPGGQIVPTAGPSFRVAGEPDAVADIPGLGQHTKSVLLDVGLASSDVEHLIETGIARG